MSVFIKFRSKIKEGLFWKTGKGQAQHETDLENQSNTWKTLALQIWRPDDQPRQSYTTQKNPPGGSIPSNAEGAGSVHHPVWHDVVLIKQ